MIPAVCAGPGIPGLVSVLIPTYNRAYIICSAIDSVLAQTYKKIEVVVVDDGSTDNTRELLARYGDAVRYIYQPNAGLAAARNTGLAAARGEFIALQDSDDLWLPWKIEGQMAVMALDQRIGLCWTDLTAVNPKGEVVRERNLRPAYDVYNRIRFEDHFDTSGMLHAVWKGCPEALRDTRYHFGDVYSAMFLGNLVHPPTALMRRTHVAKAGGLASGFGINGAPDRAASTDGAPMRLLLNILWLVVAGWWLALHHIVLAVGLALTIIGIPFAWQHIKLAGLSLTPVGKGVVEV